MANSANQRAVRFSLAVYRRLQFAYPRAHRAAYGGPMEQLFRDQCRDAWQTARTWGLAKLWLRTLPDVVSTSLLERFTNNNPGKTMNEKLATVSRPGNAASFTLFFAVFAVVFLVTLIAATAITFILPESYASTARIKVEREQPDAAQTYDPYFIQTQFEIMQSEAVLTNVINALNLNVEWGKQFFDGELLKTAETMEILKNRLSLSPVRGTKLVSITFYSGDKLEAAKLANALVQCYRDFREKQRTEPLIKRLALMESQYQEQKDAIDRAATASAQLNQLQAEHHLLYTQIEDIKLELQIPRYQLVSLIDTAEPGKRPVKPNKTLNIVLGGLAGVFLGAIAGTVAVLGLSFFTRRNPKPDNVR